MNGQYLMRLLNQFMKKTIRGFLPRTRRKAGGIRRLVMSGGNIDGDLLTEILNEYKL